MNGKITIECENNKAIFTIAEKENGETDVKVNFEPEISMKENISEPESFVTYIATMIIQGLQG